MEDIIYDYHLAQAMSRKVDGMGSMDMRRTKYFQAVLRKHEVTEAEFDSSLVYYYSHVDYLHKIYGHVNERLSDEAKVLGAGVGEISRYSQLNTTGDTANIWKNVTDVMLMPKPTMNRFDFTVTTDSTFKVGESFMFQFMSDYLWQNGTKETTVCIVSEYEDTVMQVSNRVSVSGVAQVRVPAYNKKPLKQMRGFVYLGDGGDNSNTRKILFISQIQLIRFHNQLLKDETTLKTIRLRRIASNFLITVDGRSLTQHAVEISEEGWVVRYFPLEKEMPFTEWMPGTIVLKVENGKEIAYYKEKPI